MKLPASASWCLTGQEVDHPRETTIDRLFQELLENDVDQLTKVALVNAETDTEVNVESLVNFLLTDQNGLGGASISIGYVS